MARIFRFAIMALFVCVGVSAAQTPGWQGKNKIGGKISNEAGQPVEAAKVKLVFVTDKSGTEAVTDKKGEWKIQNVAEGMFLVEFYADGFDPRQIPVQVGGKVKDPKIALSLTKEGTDPTFAVRTGAARAQALYDQAKYADSRAIYEQLLTKYPKVHQLHQLIARSFHMEKNFAAAAAQLQEFLVDNPADIAMRSLLGTELIEAGKLAEAWQVYSTLDLTQIQEAIDLLTPGYTLLRQSKPAEAFKYFDLTIKRFPAEPQAYFYRGFSAWQVGTVEKTDTPERKARYEQAKADLTKFLELTPNATEAAKAKQLLEQIK